MNYQPAQDVRAELSEHRPHDVPRVEARDDATRLPASPADAPLSSPKAFASILFENDGDRPAEDAPVPDFFIDLNLNQIVDAIAANKGEYNLRPFFYCNLHQSSSVDYRHEIMKDLESSLLFQQIAAFAQAMHDTRAALERVAKLMYKEEKQAWFVEAVEHYCGTISTLNDGLKAFRLQSHGFQAFRDYLSSYAHSSEFETLVRDTARIKADLATVQYCVLTQEDRFTVRKYDGESDYSVEVEETFAKFKQGATADYLARFRDSDSMNHIEARIVEFVAMLHPAVFKSLDAYCNRHIDFVDSTIAAFDREVQFYVSYLEYTAKLKQAGLPFCYPLVAADSKEIFSLDGFDLALAQKLTAESKSVVCNDFRLTGAERILVVSGPNQGGKTTFARTFGQLHYLASLGCPVPGREAQLFLFDQLFTHFEKEEKVENLRGKLEDDLVRIHAILERATPRSVIVMNEIFTSTTIEDEIFLSKKVMQAIIDLDALAVWVTFVDPLATFGPQTVSMLSTIGPGDPASRTFKILRRPADGLAYALAIAQKYRVTYEAIQARIAP